MDLTTTTYPSGVVVASMRTTPDRATMLAQAAECGIDADIAVAATSALLAGRATATVVSGKLASGKDTIAEMAAATIGDVGLAPAVIRQTSGPMRAEYRQIIETVADAATPSDAAWALDVGMGIHPAAIGHLVGELFDVTRDRANLPDPDERTDLNRSLLQFHADHGRRASNPDYWTHQFFKSVYAALAEGNSVFLTGCRYPNEIGPAQALGMLTVRLAVSRAVQEQRLFARDGLAPKPEALDDPNECALDHYVGFGLLVGNDDAPEPTVATVTACIASHAGNIAG